MSWPIKVTFRPNPDKEVTKEIKVDPHSSVLSLLLKSGEIYDIKDIYNYAISFKKVNLPLLDSLREAKLIQGNTVSLIRNAKTWENNHDILFNYKIHHDSGLIKSIGRYKSENNFITCLQNIPSDSASLDALNHSSKLPIVSILSIKLTAQDLMKISDFTLESLGLRGNYSVMINYSDANEDHPEFLEFLATRKPSKIVQSDHQAFIKSENKMKPKAMHTTKTGTTDNFTIQTVNENVIGIPFTISRPSKNLCPAPDVPDSFFELTQEELLEFQRGLQKNSKLVSSKSKLTSKHIPSSGTVPLKLVFNDQTVVQANFALDWTVGSIIEFIRSVILESCENSIELWTGTPCKPLTEMQKTIIECGITGPTRIIVSCKKYAYRNNLVISES